MRPQRRSQMDRDANHTPPETGRGRRSLSARVLSPEVCLVGAILVVLGGISFSGSEATNDAALQGALGRHRSPVEGLACAPDGRTVASAGRDGTLRVWDRDNPGMGQVLATARAGFSSVAFSSDGRSVLAGQFDGGVVLCDASTGAPLLPLARHDVAVRAVAFAPDGQSLVSGSDDGTIRVCDARTGELRLELHGPRTLIEGLVFTPDGQGLVSVTIDGQVVLWDAATGRIRDQFRADAQQLASVAVSPDGRSLALGGPGRITLRELATGRSRSWACGVGRVTALRYLRGGAVLAASGLDGSIVVWDLSTAEPRRRSAFRGHQAGVKAMAVSPDGATLLSAGNDDAIRSWEIASFLSD